MCVCDLACDRESQTARAPDAPGCEEGLEDLFLEAGRNSGSVVLDLDHDAVGFRSHAYEELSRAGLGRVLKQGREQARDGLGVQLGFQVERSSLLHPEFLLGWFPAAQRFVDHG